MSETIFEGTTIPNAEPVTPVSVVPPEIAELVGEGKKYRSVEDALKSVPHAQSHIQRLEDEAKALREDLARRKTTEELLEELKASGLPKEPTPQGSVPSVDPNAIEGVVAKLLEQKEAQRAARDNISKVVSSFQETFGDRVKAEEMYNKVAEEAGLSVTALNNLAATSPEAVLRLAGITRKQGGTPPAKVASSVNTDALNQGNPSELSARVKTGATTKDLVNAWRIAGQKIGKTN